MTVDPQWTDEIWKALYTVEEAGLDSITVEQWEVIPEDVCRDHELDRGRLIKRQSGTPGHQSAARRLENAVESQARKAVAEGRYGCLTTSQDLDVRLWEVPPTIRRPDVLVYKCIEPGGRVWTDDVLLAVEIVSPASEATDTNKPDSRNGYQPKMAQYALAGIECYWIVWLTPNDTAIHRIQEWRLVKGLGEYKLRSETVNLLDETAVSTPMPFPIEITYAELEF